MQRRFLVDLFTEVLSDVSLHRRSVTGAVTDIAALLLAHAPAIAETLAGAPLERRPVTSDTIAAIIRSSYLRNQVRVVADRVRKGDTDFDHGAREIADLVRAHSYYPADDELLAERLAAVEQAVAAGALHLVDGAPSRQSIRRLFRCGENRSRHVRDAYYRLVLGVAPPLTHWAAKL